MKYKKLIEMGILKTPFIVLLTELSTMDEPGGPLPWGWTGFAATMKFPEGTYPLEGVTKLPMTAPDFEGLADNEQTYSQLQAFFEAVDAKKDDENEVLRRCTGSARNQYLAGVLIYREYWNRVAKRAKLNVAIDKLLLEANGMPWQRAPAVKLPWPVPVSTTID